MGAAYRVGFALAPLQEHTRLAHDAHWAVLGSDPSVQVLRGSFKASDGEAVPYRLWPCEDPRGLVVFLHGAFDYSGAFDEIAPVFARRRLSALAIDQRGFGASASRGSWQGKNRMIKDVIESVMFFRRRYGPALPTFLVGESMGAALAIHAASRAPELGLAGLVLAAPGAVSGTWRQFFGAMLVRMLKALMPKSELVIERVSAWEFTPAAAIRLLSDPMVLRRIKPAAMFGLYKLSKSAVHKATQVRVPVLTLVGTKDDLLRTACIERLYDNLQAEKQWASFPGGPHLLLHWRHANRVLARVLNFIDQQLNAAAPGA